jgi:hypothetical protein
MNQNFLTIVFSHYQHCSDLLPPKGKRVCILSNCSKKYRLAIPFAEHNLATLQLQGQSYTGVTWSLELVSVWFTTFPQCKDTIVSTINLYFRLKLSLKILLDILKYRNKICKSVDTTSEITLRIVFWIVIRTRQLRKRYVERGRSSVRRKVMHLLYALVIHCSGKLCEIWYRLTSKACREAVSSASCSRVRIVFVRIWPLEALRKISIVFDIFRLARKKSQRLRMLWAKCWAVWIN